MPATIIEPNTTPFNTIAIDPVTLDIIENALRNALFSVPDALVWERGSARRTMRCIT